MPLDLSKYDVYKWRGTTCEPLVLKLSVEEAARLIDVDPSDLSAAVDEHGRCDVTRYVAVGACSPPPGRKP